MDALNPQSGLKPEADLASSLDRRARRNLLLLTCCQAVGQSCNTMMFAATGLSVITFYHHPEFANLPVTMQHLGVMIWVFPAALLMQRIGRSIGFRVGSLFGMAGATVMCLGLYTANFLVMCGGGLILGYAVACLQMYRFAAAELVPIHHRAKAISWVTAGGVAAAVVGPPPVGGAPHPRLSLCAFSGCFLPPPPPGARLRPPPRALPKSPHRRGRCG